MACEAPDWQLERKVRTAKEPCMAAPIFELSRPLMVTALILEQR
jgi:hypothetical protein